MAAENPKYQFRHAPAFTALFRKRQRVCAALSAIMIAYYSCFYICMAWFPEFMARRLGDNGVVSIGVYFGVSCMLLSVILSGYYTWWSITRYDVMKDKLMKELQDVPPAA